MDAGCIQEYNRGLAFLDKSGIPNPAGILHCNVCITSIIKCGQYQIYFMVVSYTSILCIGGEMSGICCACKERRETFACEKCWEQLQVENEKLKEQIRYYKKFLDPYQDKDYGNYTLEEK